MEDNMKDSRTKRIYEEIQGGVEEIIEKIRTIVKDGNARRLIIKNKEGEVVFQTPLTIGLGGATLVVVMAPVISAIGMFALFLNDYKILVEKVVDESDDAEVDAE